MNSRTKTITTIGMFCAIAYAMAAFIRIPLVPAVPFLHYEPKDVVIAFAGLIYGPFTSFVVSAIVSFLEFITFSSTGLWGLLMNVLSSCAFACTAALVYKYRKKLSGAVLGLVSGIVCMVALMLLWNYLVTPIYMGYPREAVAALLLPAFLPFNLIKGTLNAAITLLLYKPLVTALRRSHLLDTPASPAKARFSVGVALVSLLAIASCVLLVLAINQVI